MYARVLVNESSPEDIKDTVSTEQLPTIDKEEPMYPARCVVSSSI